MRPLGGVQAVGVELAAQDDALGPEANLQVGLLDQPGHLQADGGVVCTVAVPVFHVCLVGLELAAPLARPGLDDHLRFSVELDAVASLAMKVAKKTLFPAAERKDGHPRGHIARPR